MSPSTLTRAGALLLLAFLVAAPDAVLSQDLHPSRRPSPLGIASTFLNGTYVKVTYSRPYLRNRQIFGANSDTSTFLVPFGQLWRTGANEATEITTTGPLLVDGQRLEAGTYAIFTEPGPQEWVVHFSPQLGLDGTGRLNRATFEFTPDVYDPAQDVLVVSVPSSRLEEPVDQFTIEFVPAATGAELTLRWERAEVAIPINSAP